MTVYRINFASDKNYSYLDDSCLTLDSLKINEQHDAMISFSGQKFENKVKFDWPTPMQENDQGLYILDYDVDGTICFYQGLILSKIIFLSVTTKEYKVLPPSPLESLPFSYDRDVFFIHGFGYDHVRNDHKVIQHATLCKPLTDFKK